MFFLILISIKNVKNLFLIGDIIEFFLHVKTIDNSIAALSADVTIA